MGDFLSLLWRMSSHDNLKKGGGDKRPVNIHAHIGTLGSVLDLSNDKLLTLSWASGVQGRIRKAFGGKAQPETRPPPHRERPADESPAGSGGEGADPTSIQCWHRVLAPAPLALALHCTVPPLPPVSPGLAPSATTQCYHLVLAGVHPAGCPGGGGGV